MECDPPERRTVRSFASGAEHLLVELSRLRLLLYREVLRLRATGVLNEDQFRGLYVSDEQVDAVLRERHQRLDKEGHRLDLPPALSQLSQQACALDQEIEMMTIASAAAGISLPLTRLVEIFSLSALERDALLLCVAVEVDLAFETLYSYAQNDVTRKLPTPDLALRLLCDSHEKRLNHRNIFSPDGTLMGTPLVAFAANSPQHELAFLARPLKAHDRVVDFLLGGTEIDHRLQPFTTKVDAPRKLSGMHLPSKLSEELKNAGRSFACGGSILLFHGPKGAGKRTAAAALAAEMGRPLLCADITLIAASGLSLPTALSLLGREALLQGANLHLAHAEWLLSQEPAHEKPPFVLPSVLADSRFLLSLGSEMPLSALQLGRRTLAFEFPVPSFALRVRLWEEAMAGAHCRSAANVDTEALAGRFVLTGGEIRSACEHARDRALLRGARESAVEMQDLEAAARGQSNQSLRRLAQKVSPTCQWCDLVLPPRAARQLREVCATEEHRHLVYSTWGFDRRLALRPRLERSLPRFQRHRQDHGRRHPRPGTWPGPLQDRSLHRRQQIYRRNRKTTEPDLSRSQILQRDPVF